MKSFAATASQVALTLSLYFLGAVLLGVAAWPWVYGLSHVWKAAAPIGAALRFLLISMTAAAAYFLFGLTLILVVGAARLLFGIKLREDQYPLVSFAAVRWYVYNAMQSLVAIVFMDFILLTPFANALFRLMGARLGRNVQINSKFCADLSLVEIGDNSVIGGHATVIGHSVEQRMLILRKVTIGRNVVIGLNSVILPGCVISDGAVIAAGAVLPKNTRVEPGATYSGVPARLMTGSV